MQFDRITFNPAVMGGRACIRGMRVTAAMILSHIAEGVSVEEMLREFPVLEAEDIHQALQYAAFKLEERELPLVSKRSLLVM